MLLLSGIFFGSMLYYVGFIARCAWYFTRIPAAHGTALPSISVIIPARNEAATIEKCLRAVLAQDYPNIEVILVNDQSTDETGAIAEAVAATDARLRVLHQQVGGINAYKKAAVTAGVMLASGEIIVQTDADCTMSAQWLRTLASYFAPDVAMVCAPVRLSAPNETPLEYAQQFEYAGLMAIGGGSIAGKTPNMCNGANLAYRRSTFIAVNGFAGIDHIASGDDELLLQKIRRMTQERIVFARDRRAIVDTPALPTWQQLKAQRLRWVSKAKYYPNRWVNVTQALSYAAFLGFPFSVAAACYDARYWGFFTLLFALKCLSDVLLLRQAFDFLQLQRLRQHFLPMQFAYIAYVLWIGIAGNFTRTYTWKDRRVA